HYIGAILGQTGYIRDRHAEFHQKHVERAAIIREIDLASTDIATTFEIISGKDLSDKYPLEVFGHPMTVEYFLIHLQGHLNYHLGQINYHRRLLSHP
ncbi:MAG: DinB superfamily protein, partial [Saprospiraceae bacterium]|nr:DinB superfamily protein [Saprospiraceae bacterium]